MNAVEAAVIQENIRANPLHGKYAHTKDRESAYEILTQQQEEAREQEEKEQKQAEKEAKKKAAAKKKSSSSTSRKKKSALDKAVSSAANTIGRELGKSLIRGLLGTLKK